jgi:hypothetical protein
VATVASGLSLNPLRIKKENKDKVKLSLPLISYAICHENIWGSGGITPPFLTSTLDRSKEGKYLLPTQLGTHTRNIYWWLLLWRIDTLLGKDFETNNETTVVATQRHGKHASTTIDLLLETVVSNRSLQRDYKEDSWGCPASQNMVMSLVGFGPENDCAGETTSNCKRQIHPLARECFTSTVTESVQLRKENTGRGFQGVCLQVELTGGKSPAVK